MGAVLLDSGMEELEALVNRAWSLATDTLTVVTTEAQQNLEALGEEAQLVLEELIAQGETQVQQAKARQTGTAPSPTAATTGQTQPSDHLQKRMFTLTMGDDELAKRLLNQVRQEHPDQSEDWYWEKVIHDLERDRS